MTVICGMRRLVTGARWPVPPTQVRLCGAATTGPDALKWRNVRRDERSRLSGRQLTFLYRRLSHGWSAASGMIASMHAADVASARNGLGRPRRGSWDRGLREPGPRAAICAPWPASRRQESPGRRSHDTRDVRSSRRSRIRAFRAARTVVACRHARPALRGHPGDDVR
jgi:hypothetical protein